MAMASILVIDDDITIQLTLKRILLKQEYEVDIASDGETGLEKAIALTPAVIVCDWMMPGMKGPEVCQRVREIPELSATFFILLTAFDSVDDIVRGLNAGADDFLTKPPEIAELKARIRTGVRSFELKRALQLKTQELDVGLRATEDYVRSLLPQQCSNHAVSFCWEWHPCLQLGGTGMFGRWLTDDMLVFGLLDVAHQGIDAALQIAQLVTAIQCAQIADTDLAQPDRAIVALQQYIQTQSQAAQQKFGIWYGTFSPSEKQVTFASTGTIQAVAVNSRGKVTQLTDRRSQPTEPSTVKHKSLNRLSSTTDNATYKLANHPLKSGNTLYLMNSSVCESFTSQADSEDIQWLLDAEAQAKEEDGTSDEGVLPIAVDNLRKQLDADGVDGDVSLVRLRVH